VVLNGIMQQGGDGAVLATAVLQRQGADGEEMRNVRGARSFVKLVAMRGRRKGEGIVETM
jgi:hypothetical protein